jgi:protoporphyrinogen/coproporphyrinogen III oxidase
MNTVVIGGGISGLAAAYGLSKAGISCTLLEKSGRLGGVIRTEKIDGCLAESGPDSYLAAKPAALELIREVGLESEVIGSNDDRRSTFIRRAGDWVKVPDGLLSLIPSKILPLVTTPLFGVGTKAKMALEMIGRPPGERPDRSVADFVREHYSQEMVDYLVEPMLSGIFGGDAELLSARSSLPHLVALETKYGSLSRGALEARRKKPANAGPKPPLFQTLRGGLGTLVERLHFQIAGKARIVRKEAEAIRRDAFGYRIRVDGQWIRADQLILATPAWEAARLLSDEHPTLAHSLQKIRYGSSAVVPLVFDQADVADAVNGFGFLVPRKERIVVTAGTWVRNKFNDRVPAGKALLRCSITDDQRLGADDEGLIRLVREDLHRLLGIDAVPREASVARWRGAVPQYTVGHAERLKDIEEELARIPNLHLSGNGFTGLGLPDCIARSRKCVTEIVASTSGMHAAYR